MFRRSQANAGGTVERLRAVRRRIACLACSGTGEAQRRNPRLHRKNGWQMTGTDTATTAEATTQLETLAANLSRRGFATTIATGGQHPRLTVVNKAASQLSDNVYAAAAGDGSWWFWWSWAERLSPITDVAVAAQAITRVLRVMDTGR